MPSTNRLGSKVGLLTKASTSPLRGSIATSAPRRSPNSSSTSACSRMSIDSTSVLPGVGGWLLQPAHGAAAGAGLHLLEAGGAVQLAPRSSARRRACRCSRCRGSWPVVLVPVVHGLLLGLVDAADVADQVAAGLAQRVVAEQPRLDVDAGEAEALRREARHLLVAELGADRQRLEALAFFLQALEAAAVARLRSSTTCASSSISASRSAAPRPRCGVISSV